MKIAKQRHRNGLRRSPRPRYRLSDLLAQMPPGPFELDAEMQAWENMAPVGREWGSDRWQEENKEAFESWNAYVEKNGLPLAKYRKF